MLNSCVFRLYDIRGSSVTDITPEFAYRLGVCFGRQLSSDKKLLVCVGRDGRLSSPALFEALERGLLASDCKVHDIGIVPTPMLYFADKILNPAASIMITGSHNPASDNGFKIVLQGNPFFGDQITDLYHRMLQEEIPEDQSLRGSLPSLRGRTPSLRAQAKQSSTALCAVCGSPRLLRSLAMTNDAMTSSYIQSLLKDLTIRPDLKVVWDSGNGSSGEVIEKLVQQLPNHNIVINSQIDGTFPAHHPDPSVPANLAQLINTVVTNGYDLGVAFDGDADRIGVVTKDGRIVSMPHLFCLFAEDVLKAFPAVTIIADVKTSQTVFDYVSKLGGKMIMSKVGHSIIKNKITETGAKFAGEMSGHIFFADKYYGYDDAIYAALRLLSIISAAENTLEQIIAKLPQVQHSTEFKIAVDDKEKFNMIKKVKQQLQRHKVSFNDLDGVRVATPFGWWLLRASNTEPALMARIESSSSSEFDEIQKAIRGYIEETK